MNAAVAIPESSPPRPHSRALVDALRGRGLEVALVVFGAALRFTMLATYNPWSGYDSPDHFQYIEWFRHHTDLPPLLLSRETYHPPLYYIVAGAFARLTHGKVLEYGLPSMVFSTLTMLLLWFGMERHLPGRRLARLGALALFAVLPASVHPAGMMTGEGMNGLLATAGLLLGAEIIRRQRARRGLVLMSLVAGVVIGLQTLTKISGFVTLGAVCGAVVLDALLRNAPPRERIARLLPAVLVTLAFLATSEWYFSRNAVLYGKPVLSGYDGIDKHTTVGLDAIPYLKRRPVEFYYGWSNDVLLHPYYPSGVIPSSYFWPPLIGSTFVDYYNYSYVSPPPRPTTLIGNTRAMRLDSEMYARASVLGGLPIAVSTIVAWLYSAATLVRRRDATLLAFLLAPLGALLGQLHFAVGFPLDHEGPIKGVYMQFASSPLFALFGLALEFLARSRRTQPLLALCVVGLLGVTAYTIYARLIAI